MHACAVCALVLYARWCCIRASVVCALVLRASVSSALVLYPLGCCTNADFSMRASVMCTLVLYVSVLCALRYARRWYTRASVVYKLLLHAHYGMCVSLVYVLAPYAILCYMHAKVVLHRCWYCKRPDFT